MKEFYSGVNYYGIGKIIIEKCEQYVKEVFGCNEMRMKVIGRRKELIDYYITILV